MAHPTYSNEEIGRSAEEMYRREIRDKITPQHKGKFLILDIVSGDYEIDEDDLQAEERLRAPGRTASFSPSVLATQRPSRLVAQ